LTALQALDLLTRLEHHFQYRVAGLRTARRVGFPHAGESNPGAVLEASRWPALIHNYRYLTTGPFFSMLDLRQYASLGAALKDALERWPTETCLIEADRDREKVRLTYSDFKEMAQTALPRS
jgi:hypothetical protein